MTCEIVVTGTLPALTWNRDDEEIPSVDGSDIGKALISVDLDSVQPEDDKAVYHCEMIFADVVEDSCSITLDVACEFTHRFANWRCMHHDLFNFEIFINLNFVTFLL